jgi:hypothetical protein
MLATNIRNIQPQKQTQPCCYSGKSNKGLKPFFSHFRTLKVYSLMKNLLCKLLLPLVSIALIGCEGYTYTLNEQPVFSPEKLFSNFNITDTALKSCVDQVIFDQKITRANQLTHLNCSNAGISKLDGLEIFSGLTHINFNENDLIEIKPLLSLYQLQVITLEANHHLLCSDGEQLRNQIRGTTKLPTHCSR